jgi:hypothetical protein
LTVKGTLVIKGSMTPGADVTVDSGGKILVTRADANILGQGGPNDDPKINPDKGYTYGDGGQLFIAADLKLINNGTVTLYDEGSLVLASVANNNNTNVSAKLVGSGSLAVGATRIVGGPADTAGWQAISTTTNAGTVTITAGTVTTTTLVNRIDGVTNSRNFLGSNKAIIASDATSISAFTALGPGAKITQLALEDNLLTLAPSTQIELGAVAGVAGTSADADVGSLDLTGHPNYPGEIVLLADAGTNANPASVTAKDRGSPGRVTNGSLSGTPAKIGGVQFGKGGNPPKAPTINTAGGTRTAPLIDYQFMKIEAVDGGEGLKGGSDDKKPVILKATVVVEL